jgi:hypothetical protein
MTPDQISAYNRGIEDAAKIADPAYKTRKPGTWASRRIEIASKIRACKVDIPIA